VSTKYWLMAAVWYYGMVNYLDRVALSFAAPTIMKTLAIDPATFGSILASFAIGYSIAQIPGGVIADRWNAKTMLVIAPLVWAGITAMTAFIYSPTLFVVARIGLGLSEGVALGAIYKIQFDNFTSSERPMVAAVGLTPVAMAPALAGPIVGLLISYFDWRAAFIALVVPSVLVSVVVYFLIPSRGLVTASTPAEETRGAAARRGSGGSLLEILLLPSFWCVAATWFCFNFAYWGYNGWMPSYLALGRHVDVKSAGVLGGLPYVLGFVGLMLAGWLGKGRFYAHRAQLLSACYAGAGVALYAAYSSEALYASVVGLAFSAFFLMGSMTVVYSVAADLSPEASRGTYWGAVSTLGQAAGILAPWLIGRLVAETGTFAAGFYVMVAGLFLGALLILFVIPSLAKTTIRQKAQELVGGRT